MPITLYQVLRFKAIESGVEKCFGERAGNALLRPEPPPELKAGQILALQRANDGVIDP